MAPSVSECSGDAWKLRGIFSSFEDALEEKAALLASLLFVLHPLIFKMSTAIQPESIALFAYLAAIYCFIRWIQSDRLLFYCLALLSTVAAILAKLPAAQVGVFFALLAFKDYRWSPKLWFFALVSIGVPFLWYDHARGLFEEYGNSLGLSNEAYGRMGKTTLKSFLSSNIIGNLVIEGKKIWIATGVFLGIAGALSFYRNKNGKIILCWAISLILYYLLSGGTTGEEWASYYHIFSIPLACILIAQGFFYTGCEKID